MIPRAAANRFANAMGVDLHIAQQEVVLLYALSCLADAGILDRLVFKGGTYVRMMITGDTGRLSEDLDFTNAGLEEDPRPAFDTAFARPHHGVRFRLEEPYTTARRNWACAVAYAHEWDEGRFRLEISYRERPFLPARRWTPLPQLYFPALPFVPPEVPSLRLEEAIAEKLRAIQQRGTERDLYDAWRYARKGFDESLVRLLAVAKLWNDREAFDAERILRTLDEGRREWPDLERLIGRSRRRDWNRDSRAAAARFAFLRDLTPFERALVEDRRRHRLGSELLQRLTASDSPDAAPGRPASELRRGGARG
jgi:predicted nucleotidyltransferase component of viral defense system